MQQNGVAPVGFWCSQTSGLAVSRFGVYTAVTTPGVEVTAAYPSAGGDADFCTCASGSGYLGDSQIQALAKGFVGRIEVGEAGGIAVGDSIMSDTLGRAKKWTAGNTKLGRAIESAIFGNPAWVVFT
jgi:hypothetical protein